jgi:hypothetical protein
VEHGGKHDGQNLDRDPVLIGGDDLDLGLEVEANVEMEADNTIKVEIQTEVEINDMITIYIDMITIYIDIIRPNRIKIDMFSAKNNLNTRHIPMLDLNIGNAKPIPYPFHVDYLIRLKDANVVYVVFNMLRPNLMRMAEQYCHQTIKTMTKLNRLLYLYV